MNDTTESRFFTAAENQVKPKAGFWRRLQYLFRGE